MIDAMKIRKQGTPQSHVLMAAVMFSVRVGMAAYFADKTADNMLGQYGHMLKRLFELTHSSQLVLRSVLKRENSQNLIGIGGQYIVLANQTDGRIEKYSHTLAGADPEILRGLVRLCRQEYHRMRQYFGDMVLTTEYDLATLPIRGPAKRLLTLRACQDRLVSKTDLFSPEAQRLMQLPTSNALRQDLHDLYSRITSAMQQNTWLDIIGPENVVVTTDSGEPRICIIDIEAYVPEYLDIQNPMVGKTYRQVFMER